MTLKHKKKYKPLFIAARGSTYSLGEDGWELDPKNHLPKGIAVAFLEDILALNAVNDVCGIVKYVGDSVDASLILSEDELQNVESIYLQCFGDKKIVEQQFSGNTISKYAELFDPE
jgi:hypothetical protein